MIRHDRGGWIRWHRQVLTFVERHHKFEVTHADRVAIEKPSRVSPAKRLVGTVDIDAVGTDVGKVIGAALEIDSGMFSGDIVVRIGKDPVVVERTADRAAFCIELTDTVLPEEFLMFAYYFQLQWHCITRPYTSAGAGMLPARGNS